MTILSIETSCDETAVSIVEADGDFPEATYRIRGNALNSQVKLHAKYGGVFPSVAKREHAKMLVPLLAHALEEATLLSDASQAISAEDKEMLTELLQREPGLAEALLAFFEAHERPAIDRIAVTSGPGLEPALWVGVNFAKALSRVWNVPVIAVDHMEGHILAALLQLSDDTKDTMAGTLYPVSFPALALLISGGHTEMVLIHAWGTYEIIGETLDDAVGEAFDKVARMLELPYPGGPEISKLATAARNEGIEPATELPRPMLHTPELNFSFSGLKTAVLYALKKRSAAHPLTETYKKEIALDFENAVTEVFVTKVEKAIAEHNIQTVILGGGVSANTHIRTAFQELGDRHNITVFLPTAHLTTDNAIMVALAGHAHHADHADIRTLSASGNRSLGTAV